MARATDHIGVGVAQAAAVLGMLDVLVGAETLAHGPLAALDQDLAGLLFGKFDGAGGAHP